VLALITLTASLMGQATLQSRPAPPPEYVLGVGDQLVIHIVDLDDIPDRPMRIGPNGLLDLPLIGNVQASGKTMEQLKAELVELYGKYIQTPLISLNLTDDKGHPVSVVGEVNNPGVQQLQGPRRLIEVITLAGGLKADAGSKVIVTRQLHWGKIDAPGATVDPATGTSTVVLPLDELLSSKAPSDNILIEPNDIISISKADIVYVLGNVKRAGGFPIPQRGQISILQAVSLAEGLDSNAAANKTRILRPAENGDGKPQEISVDIRKIYEGKAKDIPLYADDIVFIPNSLVKSSAKRATEAILAVATGVIIYH
jgi:polysaccharide export outer membrane protein